MRKNLQILNQLENKISNILNQLVVVIFIFFSHLVYSQPREVKLIKKQKFEKLESSLAKQFSKNPSSCSAFYVQGYVYSKPVVDIKEEVNRQLNRRVELKLIK